MDPANSDQAKAWDGTEGGYWAAHADRFDQAIAGYQDRFLDAADLATSDRVLDIGCGAGQTTRDAARRATDGSALGVDLSADMLEQARRRAEREGLRNVRFEQADAQIYPFEPGSFDVAISRTGSMFFGDAPAAFSNIAGALREGGRLVLLTWQPLPANEWGSEITGALAAGRDLPAPPPGSPGPFSLSDPDHTRQLLVGAGFTDVRIEPISAPMRWGDTAPDAAEFCLGLMDWMLTGLDDETRTRALTAVHESFAAHETPDGVFYGSAAWLVRARRGSAA